jgi:hypothetical protein
VNVAYVRRWFGNFTVTDNLAVEPSNYDPFCITGPVDSRLPGGGGNPICGLYDLNPTKFGQVNNLIASSNTYGKQTEHYNGIDVTMNVRLPHRVLVSGGLSSGTSQTLGNAAQSVVDSCFVVDSPQQLRFCHIAVPWLTQAKLLGTVGLPWDLDASATFQTNPGPEILATYPVPNASIFPSLGRNPNSPVSVDLIAPGTLYGQRLYQVDARLAKRIHVGRTRIKGTFDLYNVANASTVLVQNNTFGPAWQRPTYILPGRLIKLGAQIDF